MFDDEDDDDDVDDVLGWECDVVVAAALAGRAVAAATAIAAIVVLRIAECLLPEGRCARTAVSAGSARAPTLRSQRALGHFQAYQSGTVADKRSPLQFITSNGFVATLGNTAWRWAIRVAPGYTRGAGKVPLIFRRAPNAGLAFCRRPTLRSHHDSSPGLPQVSAHPW